MILTGPSLVILPGLTKIVRLFRSEILRAAVPASAEVRSTVAATLRERVLDVQNIECLTPSMFAEESGPVRTMAVVARARAARGKEDAVASLSDSLVGELRSLGTFHESRKCTALAGLIELGQSERAVSTLGDREGVKWHRILPDSLNPDTASLGVLVDNWHVLKPLLAAAELDSELPISQMVAQGYGAIIDQGALAREALNEYLRRGVPRGDAANYFVEMARRFPRSDMLKEKLIGVFGDRSQDYSVDRVSTQVVARLLVEHFRGEADVPAKLGAEMKSPRDDVRFIGLGVLAVLAFGWPESEFWTEIARP